MLKLKSIIESEYYELPFRFIKKDEYLGRRTFLMYFIIEDIEDNILYLYTQADIEDNFFKKDLDVYGLKRNGSYLYDFNYKEVALNKVSKVLLDKQFQKVVYGDKVDYFLNVQYKDILIRKTHNIYFHTLGSMYGIDFKNFLGSNYEIDTNNSSYKNIECDSTNMLRSIDEQIDQVNEYCKNNLITDIREFFAATEYRNIDISRLNIPYIFNYSKMFKACHKAEFIKLCAIDLSRPIILDNIFEFCERLSLIDMTNLVGDYPENYFGATEKGLAEMCNLGFYFGGDIATVDRDIVVIFPSSAPNFTKLISKTNQMTFLGRIHKESRENDLLKLKAKNSLRKNYQSKVYFVIEV